VPILRKKHGITADALVEKCFRSFSKNPSSGHLGPEKAKGAFDQFSNAVGYANFSADHMMP
jgi:hypothetical protein